MGRSEIAVPYAAFPSAFGKVKKNVLPSLGADSTQTRSIIRDAETPVLLIVLRRNSNHASRPVHNTDGIGNQILEHLADSVRQ